MLQVIILDFKVRAQHIYIIRDWFSADLSGEGLLSRSGLGLAVSLQLQLVVFALPVKLMQSPESSDESSQIQPDL